MQWVFPASLPLILADTISPSVPSGDISAYLLGWGPLGLGALLLGICVWKGLLVPASKVKEDRENARADLSAEITRLLAENQRVREDLAAAQQELRDSNRFAQDQLVPVMIAFTSATQSLLPVLQELVRRRERQIDP